MPNTDLAIMVHWFTPRLAGNAMIHVTVLVTGTGTELRIPHLVFFSAVLDSCDAAEISHFLLNDFSAFQGEGRGVAIRSEAPFHRVFMIQHDMKIFIVPGKLLKFFLVLFAAHSNINGVNIFDTFFCVEVG